MCAVCIQPTEALVATAGTHSQHQSRTLEARVGREDQQTNARVRHCYTNNNNRKAHNCTVFLILQSTCGNDCIHSPSLRKISIQTLESHVGALSVAAAGW